MTPPLVVSLCNETLEPRDPVHAAPGSASGGLGLQTPRPGLLSSPPPVDPAGAGLCRTGLLDQEPHGHPCYLCVPTGRLL